MEFLIEYTRASSSRGNGKRLASTLSFPTKKNPSPFEIFNLAPSDSSTLTTKQIKARYYELCLLHHPDTGRSSSSSSNSSSSSSTIKGKGKATSTPSSDDEKFRQIVAAYEILRHPNRRATYLRTGGQSSSSSSYSTTNAGYDFSRGRPMRPGGPGAHRGTYPSSSYDYYRDPGWSDPYSYKPGGNTASTPGWEAQGVVSSNGTIFLVLLAATLLITPISVWSVVPSEPMFGSEGSVQYVGGRESRHASAARALETARREGKTGGLAKREAIRKRVREIEYERGTERALEVVKTERKEMTTGHPSLVSLSPDSTA